MDQPVAIVAGATSGIGEATAVLLAENGYRVVLAARREDRLATLSSRIHDLGGESHPVSTDLSQLDQIQNLVKDALEMYGRIDVLVNSAGYGKLVWLDQQSQEEIAHQIQVNLIGAIQLIREVLPVMLEAGKGHIIQLVSSSSWVGLPTYSIYVSTKFGLRGFLESLRRELRGTEIIVSGLYPGSVDTEFDQHAGVHWKITRVTPDWLLLSSEDVGKLILKMIRKKKANIVVPRIMWVTVLANAHFPCLVSWILSKYFYRVDGKTVAWRDRED
jgi:short-subunit dehydrogenase